MSGGTGSIAVTERAIGAGFWLEVGVEGGHRVGSLRHHGHGVIGRTYTIRLRGMSWWNSRMARR